MIKCLGLLSSLFLAGVAIGIGIDLWVRGASALHIGYLVEAPRDLGRAGGIGPILASTAIIVGSSVFLASAIGLPAAIVFFTASGLPWLDPLIRITLHVGVGVPRIVWGLFGAAVFGGLFEFGFSILTGVLTLTCLLLPIITSGFLAGLEGIGRDLHEQCRAIGVSQWTSLWLQILPAARPSVTSAMALAAARGCGDAAALLFTAGVATSMPSSVYDSGATLSVFIYQLLNTVPGGQNAAYAAAAILFTFTFVIQGAIAKSNQTARFI